MAMTAKHALERFPDQQKYLIRPHLQARYSLPANKIKKLIARPDFPKSHEICGSIVWLKADIEKWEAEQLM